MTKKVAAYCRVSTDKEDQTNSFESQKSYFKEYIERMPGWELWEIYADEGVSGTSTQKRRAFKRMIDDALRGCFDLILTKEISRFARNTLDSIYYTRKLKKNGIGVVFMNDGINTLDPDAELRLTILSSIAQEESRKTSERIKWGQKRRMEQGIVFGRSMLGYDVRGGKLIINEEGAQAVRLIFGKFVEEGKGAHVIARELREAGIETSTHMKEWSNTVIFRILRNEKYCGDLIQKKTYTPDYLNHEKKANHGEEEKVVLYGHHEPIVSRELFERARRELACRAPSAAAKQKYSNRYPLSGKIKCGHCGANFVSRYRKRKDGTVYRAWRCAEAVRNGKLSACGGENQRGCDNSRQLREKDCLSVIGQAVKLLPVNKTEFLDELASLVRAVVVTDMEDTEKTEKLLHKRDAVLRKKERLINLYLNEEITNETFHQTNEMLNRNLGFLENEIKAQNTENKSLREQNETVEAATDAIRALVLGEETDENFYRSILDRVVVWSPKQFDVYFMKLPIKYSF